MSKVPAYVGLRFTWPAGHGNTVFVVASTDGQCAVEIRFFNQDRLLQAWNFRYGPYNEFRTLSGATVIAPNGKQYVD